MQSLTTNTFPNPMNVHYTAGRLNYSSSNKIKNQNNKYLMQIITRFSVSGFNKHTVVYTMYIQFVKFSSFLKFAFDYRK